MSTTTTTQETISDAQQDDTILGQPGSYYGHLGKDDKIFHHHVDERTNTIYVTQRRVERFLLGGSGLFWFRVCGEDAHVEAPEKYDERHRSVCQLHRLISMLDGSSARVAGDPRHNTRWTLMGDERRVTITPGDLEELYCELLEELEQ